MHSARSQETVFRMDRQPLLQPLLAGDDDNDDSDHERSFVTVSERSRAPPVAAPAAEPTLAAVLAKLSMLAGQVEELHRVIEDQQANFLAAESTPIAVGRVSRAKRSKFGTMFSRNILLFTLLWQALNVGILTLLDHYLSASDLQKESSRAFLGGIIVMVIFQMLHMVATVMSSMKLVKQIIHHTATSSFLIQSYLSTMMLFAGVYTLLFRLQVSMWTGLAISVSLSSDTYILEVFVRMLYFSTATMTGVGFGDIHPVKWYAYLLVTLEMLLGVVYSVAILGRGLAAISGPQIPTIEREDVPNNMRPDAADPAGTGRVRELDEVAAGRGGGRTNPTRSHTFSGHVRGPPAFAASGAAHQRSTNKLLPNDL